MYLHPPLAKRNLIQFLFHSCDHPKVAQSQDFIALNHEVSVGSVFVLETLRDAKRAVALADLPDQVVTVWVYNYTSTW